MSTLIYQVRLIEQTHIPNLARELVLQIGREIRQRHIGGSLDVPILEAVQLPKDGGREAAIVQIRVDRLQKGGDEILQEVDL